ncbi:MAG TPA: alpha-glucan family phosphorylase [Frateuria sp.]|uniref:alpha-glucan family phosphorylase n=1 Tax=Frateuria sp. TaxID=2211372 RepID=UPI002D7EBD7E|nr:alpha-glucan family phosphorylase [Frateuria sp.]HET6805500.1 alpha-glucan family phosphorylase [Frateuria sp.]
MNPDTRDAAVTATGLPSTMAAIGPFLPRTHIAYFSMEIALEPPMHTYAGGLGVLAGDTARAAADLELPMVFVTLMSREGYLRQAFDAQGNQLESADPWAPETFVHPLRAKVAVLVECREVWVRPWLYRLQGRLGHVLPVLLLDTDLPENDPQDRGITGVLYGGDATYRLRQEIVLGIAGMRVLHALGFEIATYHLNEGHAALLGLELLRRYPLPPDTVGAGELAFDAGPVRRSCVFTTHTPVEAGHDRFPYALYERLLPGYLDSGQVRLLAGPQALNLTQLALNLAGFVNGVAVRHAEVTERLFPGYDVRAVTNGVYLPDWVHPAFAALFNRCSDCWVHDPETLARFDQVPDADVWQAHERARADLIAHVAGHTGVALDAQLPILGFARRMTAYKRPTLLFTDTSRLRAIHAKSPFQVVIAGKAHPRDEAGKALVRQLHALARELAPQIRLVFLPDYDLAAARVLVAGCDVWLNTPLPPMEASGTSGMKAAANGVLNLSVRDGWWVEGCIDGVTGWSLGEEHDDATASRKLYDCLEQVVLPLYQRNRAGWIGMMKQSVAKLASYFNAHRMMRRYASEAYLQRRGSAVRGATHPPA